MGDVGSLRPHPLHEVSSSWPNWVRWMLHGIVTGNPLPAQEIVRHVVDADAPPPLPMVEEPAGAEMARLIDIRFGRGCYGLAQGARLEFGSRLTLVYGENLVSAGVDEDEDGLDEVGGRRGQQRIFRRILQALSWALARSPGPC